MESLPLPPFIVLARALPVILIPLVLLEASIVLMAEPTVTGELVELVTVKVVEYFLTDSLPFLSTTVIFLSVPFLTVSEPLPIVKITFEPLIEALEIAAPSDILSSVA